MRCLVFELTNKTLITNMLNECFTDFDDMNDDLDKLMSDLTDIDFDWSLSESPLSNFTDDASYENLDYGNCLKVNTNLSLSKPEINHKNDKYEEKLGGEYLCLDSGPQHNISCKSSLSKSESDLIREKKPFKKNEIRNELIISPTKPLLVCILQKCDEMVENFEKYSYKGWTNQLTISDMALLNHKYNLFKYSLPLTKHTIPGNINYCKTLEGFSSYDEELRFYLFKTADLEMGLLSLMSLSDIELKCWLLQKSSFIFPISLKVIFSVFGENLDDTFCDICKLLPLHWRKDVRFRLILKALLLHCPQRDNISSAHREEVQQAFDFYLFLLTQYLKKQGVLNITIALFEVQNFLQSLQKFCDKLIREIKAGGVVTLLYQRYGTPLVHEIYDLC